MIQCTLVRVRVRVVLATIQYRWNCACAKLEAGSLIHLRPNITVSTYHKEDTNTLGTVTNLFHELVEVKDLASTCGAAILFLLQCANYLSLYSIVARTRKTGVIVAVTH